MRFTNRNNHEGGCDCEFREGSRLGNKKNYCVLLKMRSKIFSVNFGCFKAVLPVFNLNSAEKRRRTNIGLKTAKNCKKIQVIPYFLLRDIAPISSFDYEIKFWNTMIIQSSELFQRSLFKFRELTYDLFMNLCSDTGLHRNQFCPFLFRSSLTLLVSSFYELSKI